MAFFHDLHPRPNFATERWAASWEHQGQKPPEIIILLSNVEHNWIGNLEVYYWYRNQSILYKIIPEPIEVALMALEKWFYDEIDTKKPILWAIELIIENAKSVAFAGVLGAVARKDPSLLVGILQPLLSVPEILYWEYQKENIPEGYFQSLLWSMEGKQFAKLVQEWQGLPHRRISLNYLAKYLFLNSKEIRPFFEEARKNWLNRLHAIKMIYKMIYKKIYKMIYKVIYKTIMEYRRNT